MSTKSINPGSGFLCVLLLGGESATFSANTTAPLDVYIVGRGILLYYNYQKSHPIIFYHFKPK
jgi:hypothetical protein